MVVLTVIRSEENKKKSPEIICEVSTAVVY